MNRDDAGFDVVGGLRAGTDEPGWLNRGVGYLIPDEPSSGAGTREP